MEIELSESRRVNHECDPLTFHCAYTHTPELVDVLLHSIQLKEPDFYDESLTRGLPESVILFINELGFEVSISKAFLIYYFYTGVSISKLFSYDVVIGEPLFYWRFKCRLGLENPSPLLKKVP